MKQTQPFEKTNKKINIFVLIFFYDFLDLNVSKMDNIILIQIIKSHIHNYVVHDQQNHLNKQTKIKQKIMNSFVLLSLLVPLIVESTIKYILIS
jgi:hypothetical protein